jgi:hypothetical protein
LVGRPAAAALNSERLGIEMLGREAQQQQLVEAGEVARRARGRIDRQGRDRRSAGLQQVRAYRLSLVYAGREDDPVAGLDPLASRATLSESCSSDSEDNRCRSARENTPPAQ